MATTLSAVGLRRYQNPRPNPAALSESERFEVRQLYLRVVSPLRPRPLPREFWDDCARPIEEALSRNAWTEKTVAKLREALAEAQRQGTDIHAATVDQVRIFFDALAALTLRGFEIQPANDLGTALLEVTEESSEVIVAAARLQHEESESALEAARQEAIEAEGACETVVSVTSRRLSERRSMRVVRS